jgi:hypothetical protein
MVPIQNSSSTEQFVGPSLVGDHVVPPSSLANTPTSVPRYTNLEFAGCTTTLRIGACGNPAPTSRQDAAASTVRHTLPEV